MKKLTLSLSLLLPSFAVAATPASPFALNSRWLVEFSRPTTAKTPLSTSFKIVHIDDSPQDTTAFGSVKGYQKSVVLGVYDKTDGTILLSDYTSTYYGTRLVRTCAFEDVKLPLNRGLVVNIPDEKLIQAGKEMTEGALTFNKTNPRARPFELLKKVLGRYMDGSTCTARQLK